MDELPALTAPDLRILRTPIVLAELPAVAIAPGNMTRLRTTTMDMDEVPPVRNGPAVMYGDPNSFCPNPP